VIETAGEIVGAIKSFSDLFGKKDTTNAQIVDALKTLNTQDEQILSKLALVSAGIDKVDADVIAGNIKNQESWTLWYEAGLRRPVVDLTTQLGAYAQIQKPSKKDRSDYLNNVRKTYESFSGPISDAEVYGNPVALQMTIAMLSEEKAGEEVDPQTPKDEDAAWIALRLQILKSRLGLLERMLGTSNPATITSIITTNKGVLDTLGPQLDYVDQHYAGQDMLSFQEKTTPSWDDRANEQTCTKDVVVGHFVHIDGSKEKGYTAQAVTRQISESAPTCKHYGHGAAHEGEGGGGHEGGGRFMLATNAQISLPGVPAATPGPDGQIHWDQLVDQYNRASQAFVKAELDIKQLSLVQDSVRSSLAVLQARKDRLLTACSSLKKLKCDGDVPHLVVE